MAHQEFSGLVYRITNQANGKLYIGQTIVGLRARLIAHLRLARAGSDTALHRAIRKYGEAAFVIAAVATAKTKAELNRLERFYIKETGAAGAGYNMTLGGEGLLPTPELRARIRASALVAHNTPEVLARHRDANRVAANKPERRAKLKATLAAPAERARRSARAKEQNARMKDRLAATSVASWTDPTVRTARQAGQRAWWASRTPAQREAHRAATKEGRRRAREPPTDP